MKNPLISKLTAMQPDNEMIEMFEPQLKVLWNTFKKMPSEIRIGVHDMRLKWITQRANVTVEINDTAPF